MQNVPYLIILYLRLMHLREKCDRTSHAAYPAARRTTNLAVRFSLNSTFYLIDVKKRPLLQKNLLKKFNTSPILYRLLFLHTNLYNFSVTHHS